MRLRFPCACSRRSSPREKSVDACRRVREAPTRRPTADGRMHARSHSCVHGSARPHACIASFSVRARTQTLPPIALSSPVHSPRESICRRLFLEPRASPATHPRLCTPHPLRVRVSVSLAPACVRRSRRLRLLSHSARDVALDRRRRWVDREGAPVSAPYREVSEEDTTSARAEGGMERRPTD
jgi:hypothetical protein